MRWVDADAQLEVTSPGGFTGGVTAANVLTTRHSRYPALADLFPRPAPARPTGRRRGE